MISLSSIPDSASEIAQSLYGHEELGSVSFESIGDLLAYEINLAWAADESKGPGSMSPEGLIGLNKYPRLMSHILM